MTSAVRKIQRATGQRRGVQGWIRRVPVALLVVKNLPARRHKRHLQFDPWVRKIPWRRAWQPTSVFLPGESYGQRSLEGYSPLGHKESDTTEATYHV